MKSINFFNTILITCMVKYYNIYTFIIIINDFK